MTITDELFVSFTSYTRSGERRSTPVWIVALGNESAGIITAAESWKMKRIRNDARCELQASDGQGTPIEGSIIVRARGREAKPEELAAIRTAMVAKYGATAEDWPIGSPPWSPLPKPERQQANCSHPES